MAARLHHTNIVPVFDVGQHDGIHFYTMQFIEGQGLDQVIAELIRMRTEPPVGLEVECSGQSSRRAAVSRRVARSLISGQFEPSAADVSADSAIADARAFGLIDRPVPWIPELSKEWSTSIGSCIQRACSRGKDFNPIARPDGRSPTPPRPGDSIIAVSRGSACKWPRRWTTCTRKACCIATSSRPTCCSTRTESCGSPTLVWPATMNPAR